MSLTEPVPALPDAHADDALRCPLCEYDLRGLTQNRCPECGHAFDPAALRAARRQRLAWLFEHAPRRSLVAAWIFTLLRSFWPLGFWRRVTAANAVVPRRLVSWALLCVLVPALIVGGTFAVRTARAYQTQLSTWNANAVRIAGLTPGYTNSQFSVYTLPSGQNLLVTAKPTFATAAAEVWSAHDLEATVWMNALALAWPLATAGATAVFLHTMRRAGIRQRHIWRCILYAWPSVLLLPTVLTEAASFARIRMIDPYNWLYSSGYPLTATTLYGWSRELHMTPATLMSVPLIALIATIHFTVSHVRYLKVPQAFVQAILVQAVAWLALIAAADRLNGLLFR